MHISGADIILNTENKNNPLVTITTHWACGPVGLALASAGRMNKFKR